uniref:Uncharacterized protein n=1 Tax=Cajanus cajan TaxID=3821 RepID=A0A151TRL2_CAJCA|nr:hypothetical protein KK1_008898 [Cajanus cajan]
MKPTWLPKSICDTIDERCLQFVWGDLEDKRTFHLTQWKFLCQPKDHGGVEIKDMRMIN